jgi:hypothetical protein
MSNYQEFLASKRIRFAATGREFDRDSINPILFDFQKDITEWAVKKGRCAVFLDTGLGKTFVQLEWARLIGGRCNFSIAGVGNIRRYKKRNDTG